MTYPINAINKVIRVLGLTTVNRVDLQDPMIADAIAALSEADRELQAPGLWFNREYDVTFNLVDNGTDGNYIAVPTTALNVEFYEGAQYTITDRKVRDLVNKTTVFTEDLLVKQVIYQRAYNDTPVVYQLALVAKARRDFFAEKDGEAALLQVYSEDYNAKMFEVRQEDMKRMQTNALNNPISTRLGVGMRYAPTLLGHTGVIGGYQWRLNQ